MTVDETLAEAERLLPGLAQPEGRRDPRWHAIIEVSEFLETSPAKIWPFILQWGRNPDEDLRTAIATCLLEHLLQYHFREYFLKVEQAAMADLFFADTFARCWKFGQSEEPANAKRFDRLQSRCRMITDPIDSEAIVAKAIKTLKEGEEELKRTERLLREEPD